MLSKMKIKNIKNDVEKSLSEYLLGKYEKHISEYNWDNLSGTGSTSKRFLISPAPKEHLPIQDHSFVIKKFIIDDDQEKSRRHAENEYKCLLTLSRFQDNNIWITPAAIEYLPAHALIIMGYCSGQNVGYTFWNLVQKSFYSRRNLKEILHLIDLVATALLAMQKDLKNVTLPVSQFDKSLFFLHKQIDDISVIKGTNATWENRLIDFVFETLPEAYETVNLAFQHSDYTLNNLIQSKDKIAILDFPKSCWGTKFWDISHMIITLEDFKICRNVDKKIIDACKDRFLSHFHAEKRILTAFQLINLCFSYKINLMNSPNRIKKLLIRNPVPFYEKRILECLKSL